LKPAATVILDAAKIRVAEWLVAMGVQDSLPGWNPNSQLQDHHSQLGASIPAFPGIFTVMMIYGV
jgi:hypothetical protein